MNFTLFNKTLGEVVQVSSMDRVKNIHMNRTEHGWTKRHEIWLLRNSPLINPEEIKSWDRKRLEESGFEQFC